MLLAGEDFTIVPQRPGIDLGRCLYQHDFQGGVLFQHRTQAKWRYSGPQKELPGFQHASACEAALSELRSCWNGIIFRPGQRCQRSVKAEAEFVTIRVLSFLTPGEEPRVIELLPDGEIGEGRSPSIMNWNCEAHDDDGGVDLIFHDAFGPRWRFKPSGQERWIGESVLYRGVQAFLAIGSLVPSRTDPVRYTDLWAQWPRPGHYRTCDDGQL